MSTSSAVVQEHRSPGRRALLLGLGLAAAGIIGYVVQVSNQRLAAPWYMPCLATAGAALIAGSLWKRRTFWRALSLLLVVLLAGAEWAFLFATRLPSYSGPVAKGRPMPEFETMQTDGTPFTRRDLAGGQNHLFVFFRGRW